MVEDEKGDTRVRMERTWKKNLKKLFKDQKIKIDPILKYRRTKESEVFVDTTQIRAGKMDAGAHNIAEVLYSTVVYVRMDSALAIVAEQRGECDPFVGKTTEALNLLVAHHLHGALP